MRSALFGVAALLVLVSAATLLLTPRSNTFDRMGVAPGHDEDSIVGARIYADLCARCHGEGGRGMPPKFPALRASPVLQSESPLPLLSQVVASAVGSEMPAYGPRLTNEEIVAVVNHVRRAWAEGRPPIAFPDGAPPAALDALNRRFAEALKAEDLEALLACYAASPRLVRAGGLDAVGESAVREAWARSFDALEASGTRVVRVSLPGARYAREAGGTVVAVGRVYREVRSTAGAMAAAEGRFVRVYVEEDGAWRIAFDYAEAPLPGLSKAQ